MLEKLLEEIRKGGTLQPGSLATRLNISTVIVEAMLADLERMGMLAQINTDCGESCGDCPMVNGCSSSGNKGRLRMLVRQKPVRPI